MAEPDIYWNPSISRVACFLTPEQAETLIQNLRDSEDSPHPSSEERAFAQKMQENLKRAVANSK